MCQTATPTTVSAPSPTSTQPSQPVPNPTANWNNYENSKFGLNFKYPIDFDIKEEDFVDKTKIGTLMKRISLNDKNVESKLPAVADVGDSMLIDLFVSPTELTSRQVFEAYYQIVPDGPGPKKIEAVRTFNIGGKNAYQGKVYYGATFSREIATTIADGEKIFKISFNEGTPEYPFTEELEKTYDQILSTFKFE